MLNLLRLGPSIADRVGSPNVTCVQRIRSGGCGALLCILVAQPANSPECGPESVQSFVSHEHVPEIVQSFVSHEYVSEIVQSFVSHDK